MPHAEATIAPTAFNERGGIPKKIASDRRSKAYNKTLENIDPVTEQLLIQYSKVPKDQVFQHVHTVRDNAWEVFPYPCVGQWRFLELSISQNPKYQEALERVKGGQKLLDLGCCVGQDLRKITADGAPSENLTGSDLNGGFWPIGYDLFVDKDTFKAKFHPADLFATGSSSCELTQLQGTQDIIHAGAFFHLFTWDAQVDAAKKCLSLLKRKPGSMIFGRHSGTTEPKEKTKMVPKEDGTGMEEWKHFGHTDESWKQLWEQVGRETGTKWEVQAESKHSPNWGGHMIPDRTRMKFSCILVEA